MNRRLRLRSDLIIVEQVYRGQQIYIVKDPETHKYFRFKPLEVLIMQEFNGERTVSEVAALLQEQGLPYSAAAIERFAQKLNRMDIFERSLAEKSVLLMERLRAERHRRVKGTHYEGSLMRMRWSVGDPDKLFDRWVPRLKFFFTPAFIVVSVGLFLAYFAILATHWQAIKGGIAAMYTASFYTLDTIILFWLTAMIIIAIHELGHGFTCKYFGGHVHEMGAMLIYFQPAFYCNVNDAWTFPELRQRLWVTAAGGWIELVVAAIAAIVWITVDPGSIVSRISFFSILIAGGMGLLANANPLIPLDGYYALSDYLEIQNLRHRAFGYLSWLVKRHVLRMEIPEPPADEREKKIFLIYAVLALVYIAAILTFVVSLVFGLVSRAFGAIGAVAFILLLWLMLRRVIWEWAHAVVTSIREHRAFWGSRKLWRRVGAVALLVLAFGFLVPWPITVKGTFTSAAVLNTSLAAPVGSVVDRVYAIEGAEVAAGAPLVRLRNLTMEREAVVLRRTVDSLGARLTEARARASVASLGTLEARHAEYSARLAAAQSRLEQLTIRAPFSGVVVTPRLEETIGRWFDGGDIVVEFIRADTVELRVALQRHGATWVEPGQTAEIISHADVGKQIRATVSNVSAAGSAGEGVVEARIRLSNDGYALRPGVTGEAKITVRHSNVFGALLWAIRKLIRNDILL